MKRLLISALLLGFVAPGALAAPDASAVVTGPDAVAAPAPANAVAPAKERLGDPEGEVTTDDVIEAGKDGIGKVREAMNAPTLLSILGAISAGLWALLAAVRKFGGVVISGKVTRWITLIITPIATFTGAVAMGMGWVEALTIAGGGPGALLLNELLRTFGSGDSSGAKEGSAGSG